MLGLGIFLIFSNYCYNTIVSFTNHSTIPINHQQTIKLFWLVVLIDGSWMGLPLLSLSSNKTNQSTISFKLKKFNLMKVDWFCWWMKASSPPARCAPSRPPLQWKDKLIHSFPFIHQSSFHQLILVGLVLLFSSFGGAPAAGSGHNPPKKRTTQTNNSTVLRGKWNRAVHQKPLVFSSLCSFIPLGANARQQPTFFILPIRKRRMKRKFGLLNGLAR